MNVGRYGERGLVALAVACTIVVLAGCGSSGSGSTAPSVTSTPIVTPAPTATPTSIATPAYGVAQVVAQSGSTASCLQSVSAAPGTYVSIQAAGTLASGAFASAPSTASANRYTVTTVVSPNASPSPIPTTSAGPTSGSTQPGTATMLYLGSYNVPAFVGAGFTANATTGCFALQVLSGSTTASASGAFVAAPGTLQTAIGGGTVTALAINGITPTSGTGTFTLDNGTSGTITIAGSEQLLVSGDPTTAVTDLLRRSAPHR